jgi:hypothetical protein
MLTMRVCCPGESVLSEKNSIFFKPSPAVTTGAVNFTVDLESMVYEDVGVPYTDVTPTTPYTLIADPI